MKSQIKKENIQDVTKERYLHYAMSVVKGRALPDVRDGLKPSQRRLLYAMYHDLKLTHNKPHRKSAAVVGETMGNYHPHGDASLYGTLVKMAQPFSTNIPLIDGYGNFGSIDGDSAAAMRYTESRLSPIASELMTDLKKNTVRMKKNYDNTTEEPEVLPTRIPLLLVNGAIGIAVGMSTSVPPHNLSEVCDAVIDLIRNPNRRISTLVKHHIKGPDFPTGGTIVEDRDEITEIYEEGSGSVTIRASWEIEDSGRRRERIVFSDLPYNVNKEKVVEKIAEYILDDELPQVKDVIDESTDDIRIGVELKQGANLEPVLAFLFKKTPLEDKFQVNLTCLRPEDGMESPVPEKMNLKSILEEYIDFRMKIIKNRLEYDLEKLKKRIHILEGYESIFSRTDDALEIIQSCSEKSEAKKELKAEFDLDNKQVSSVLNSKIYRLMEGEKKAIQEELEDKRRERDHIEELLSDHSKREKVLIDELKKIKKEFGEDRKSRIEKDVDSYKYDESQFIEEEDVKLIVSRGGWTSYQKSYSSLDKLYIKDNDEVGWVIDTDTRSTAMFFTNEGRVYTERVAELESTTGYGNPIQAEFDFDNGEQIIAVHTSNEFDDDDDELIALCSEGKGVRISPSKYEEPSTVRGRKFKKTNDEYEVLNVCQYTGDEEKLAIVTEEGRINVFDPGKVSFMKSSAYGVRSIKLENDDKGVAFQVFNDRLGKLKVETSNGAERKITEDTYDSRSRSSEGHWLIKRGSINKWIREPVEVK
jgi:DNA gyrase subunit A